MGRKLVRCTNKLCLKFNVEWIVIKEDNYCDYCGKNSLEVIREIKESSEKRIKKEYRLPKRLLEIKDYVSKFKLKGEEKEILLAFFENYKGNKMHKNLILQYFDVKYQSIENIPFHVWNTLQEMADKGIIVYENDYFEDISPRIYNFLYEKMPEKFEKLIPEFYYITHTDNIALIIQKGILSFNKSKNTPHFSIADDEVQSLREEKYVSGLPLHDYANVYFAKKTPMHYVRKDSQDNLCYICVKKDILLLDGVYFTDGNAASSATKFYTDLKDLDKESWDFFDPEKRCYEKEEKRKKQAEVLVPYRIPTEKFQRIVVYDEKMFRRIRAMINKDIPINIDRNFYF